MEFCSRCGNTVRYGLPPGDDHERYFCDRCGTVHYQNPKMVVGTIARWEDRILLCRRAIKPREGFWTLPAGFLELGETAAGGARRETLEEAGVDPLELRPFALFNIVHVGQLYLMFSARMESPQWQAGAESLEVALFERSRIPWDEIAFPVIEQTLRLYLSDWDRGVFDFHMQDVAKSSEPIR